MNTAYLNHSVRVSRDQLLWIAEATAIQSEECAEAHGFKPRAFRVIEDESQLQAGEILQAVFDQPDQPNVLGYHDVSPGGVPYEKVFTISLDNGGTVLDGPLAFSVTCTHEDREAEGDPFANLWADDGQGVFHAYELSDVTEGDAYPVQIGTQQVWVTNWVRPEYFCRTAKGPRDRMGLILNAFDVRPSGYDIRCAAGVVSQFNAHLRPEWQIQHKLRHSKRLAMRFGLTP